MTIREYIENRDSKTYGKVIRVLDAVSHTNMGHWSTLQNKNIVDVKITKKHIFIFI
jgi:hypothetical protein